MVGATKEKNHIQVNRSCFTPTWISPSKPLAGVAHTVTVPCAALARGYFAASGETSIRLFEVLAASGEAKSANNQHHRVAFCQAIARIPVSEEGYLTFPNVALCLQAGNKLVR